MEQLDHKVQKEFKEMLVKEDIKDLADQEDSKELKVLLVQKDILE